MFPELNEKNSDLTATPQKLRYFADQNGQKEGPHENEFWQFSNTKMNIADD